MFHINSNSQFLINLERLIISDEIMVRLLFYPSSGWDEENQRELYDPLDSRNPNLVNEDSDEYWEIVKDKFRKGSKRMQIEDVKSVVLYMHEGRERPIWGNSFINTKEVVFKIVAHEDFEEDTRISRISSRLSYLLTHEIEIAGYGKLRLSGKNYRESPLGNRLQEDIYLYNVLSKSKG